MIIETMTLNELAAAMRSYGIKVTSEFLAAGIEQGAYPFAICIRAPEGKQRRFEIYRKLFLQWVEERATPSPDDGGVV